MDASDGSWREHLLILFLPVILFGVGLATIVWQSLAYTGTLTYVLDDPYIHLSVASNLSHHSAWSINTGGFSGTTSSLTWPLLLAGGIYLGGESLWWPFIFASISGLVSILYIESAWNRYGVPNWLSVLGLVMIVVYVPFIPMVMTGMEHLLHLFLTFVCATAGARYISADDPDTHAYGILLVASAAVTATRYEGALLVGVIALLLAARGGIKRSLLLLATGAAPLLLFGAFSILNGGFLLPNSVLVKTLGGETSFLIGLVTSIVGALYGNSYLLSLLIPSVIISYFQSEDGFWEVTQILSFLFITTTILHISIASLGWFFRYEAYLIGFGIFTIVLSLSDVIKGNRTPNRILDWGRSLEWSQAIIIIILISVLITPLTARAIIATVNTPTASQDIHTQHGQMSNFVDTYYDDTAVAANDIGMLSYHHDGFLLDLWGLGSSEVASAKLNNDYGPQTMARLVRENNVEVIIIYREWFERYGGVPDSWIRVGVWDTNQKVVGARDRVSFYAVNTSTANELQQNLCNYSSNLPDRVEVSGNFTRSCASTTSQITDRNSEG